MLGKLFLFLATAVCCLGQNQNWTKFVEDIEGAIVDFSSYILPVDNEEFFGADTSNITESFGTFDFIIVGGGTAGGVLANRLTEKNFTVLVLEAGTEGPSWSPVLGLSAYTYQSQWNWGYNTTSQTNGCLGSENQQCFYPRGKVLGGCSVINTGIFIRGNAEDYDRWAELGNEGWSYNDCLPYFKKSEKANFTKEIDDEYHGFEGPQVTGDAIDTPGLVCGFEDLGMPLSDVNGRNQSTDRIPYFINYNARQSTVEAFIVPASNRTNLNITTQCLVTKILLTNKTAYGVEFVRSGQAYVALANKEVILSAGSINTPQLLMLSGIGPKAHLEELDIDVIQDLPVGQNLQDHVMLPAAAIFRTNQIFYNLTLEEELDLWKVNERPLTTGLNGHGVSFAKYSNSSLSRPDVEFLSFGITPTLFSLIWFKQEYQEAFSVINSLTDVATGVILLHPKSRGNVTLQSQDPKDFPLINPNYFAEPEDIEMLYQGTQTVVALNNTKTYQNWTAELLKVPIPDCDGTYTYLSKDWWYCYIRYISATIYHPVGTTSMGNDSATSVVDCNLKVHGIENLRVVDAGVIPEHISGHPNAAVVMIAEKISDVIKEKYC